MLTLFDIDGVTPLISVDDTFYDGNTFGSGDFADRGPVFRQRAADPAGNYTIEVKAFNGAIEAAGDNTFC